MSFCSTSASCSSWWTPGGCAPGFVVWVLVLECYWLFVVDLFRVGFPVIVVEMCFTVFAMVLELVCLSGFVVWSLLLIVLVWVIVVGAMVVAVCLPVVLHLCGLNAWCLQFLARDLVSSLWILGVVAGLVVCLGVVDGLLLLGCAVRLLRCLHARSVGAFVSLVVLRLVVLILVVVVSSGTVCCGVLPATTMWSSACGACGVLVACVPIARDVVRSEVFLRAASGVIVLAPVRLVVQWVLRPRSSIGGRRGSPRLPPALPAVALVMWCPMGPVESGVTPATSLGFVGLWVGLVVLEASVPGCRGGLVVLSRASSHGRHLVLLLCCCWAGPRRIHGCSSSLAWWPSVALWPCERWRWSPG